MNSNTGKSTGIFSNFVDIILTIVISIPLYIILSSSVRSMGIHEDEIASFGFTVVVIMGVFIGRYLASIWGRNLDVYPRRLLISLCLLSLGLTFWVFFYTEFPLRERRSISVLLFVLPLFAKCYCRHNCEIDKNSFK